MSEPVMDGLLRAIGTIVAALLALPLVAWIESLRGRSSTTPGVVVGPRGARTALATAFKLLEKRAPRRVGTDRLLHASAPVLAVIPTLSVLAVIPLQPNDPVAATLPFALALPLLSTGAVALAGYGSGDRLAHLAALRLVALRMSVLVVVAAASLTSARIAGSVELTQIVGAQTRSLVTVPVPMWTAIVAPTAFIAALAALAIHAQQILRARTEPTLAESWIGDATGPVLLGHRVFESLDLVAGACVLAVVFLGGWHVPYVDGLPNEAVTIVKAALALFAIIATRNALPTLATAVAVRVCFIVLLPLAVLGFGVIEILGLAA